jgi:hypothetical protein
VECLGPLLAWAVPFADTLAYRMRLAAHHVLANTAADRDHLFPCSQFLSEDEQKVQEIDGLVGLSPELLNIIQCIISLAFNPGSENQETAKALVHRLRDLCQVCSDTYIDQDAKNTIESTAETYRLGALEYIDCRFHG